jgi:DNA-binding transcriptional LysR family regulator
MDLRRLRTFVTIADQGTVSRAASLLRITQPALSRQIGDLQQELGLSLFTRMGRRLVLTPEGEQLAEDCRALLGQAESLSARARSLRDGETGILRVAAAPQTIENVLPEVLRWYAEGNPGVEVKLSEALAFDHLAMLDRGEVDLAINVAQDGDARFASYPLPPLEVLAAHDRSLRIGDAGLVEVHELARLPVLLPTSGFATRKLFDAGCRLAHLKPHIVIESAAPRALLALAAAGHGVAIIPSTVRTASHALRVARVAYRRKPLQTPRAILWDKRRALPDYADRFCQMLAGHMNAIFPVQSR